MEGFLISGIVIGLVCIVVSFIVKEDKNLNKEDKEKLIEELRTMLLNEQSIESLVSEAKNNFNDKLNDLISDKISQLEDSLNEKTSSKMMALDEMYEGMLSKIDHNHKEVLFLYDMLKQKGEEIKALSSHIEGMRKALAEEEKKLVLTYQYINKKVKLMNESMAERDKMNVQRLQNEDRITSEDKKVEKRSEELPQQEEKEESLNMNEKILALDEQGKSVLEISKELGIGQGEVKLILGLFSKNK